MAVKSEENLLSDGYRGRGSPCHIVAVITLAQGLWIGAHQAAGIVERTGGLTVPIGMADPEETLRVIAHFHPNFVIGSPSYMAVLTRTAEEEGFRAAIASLVLGGEILSPEHERYFAEYWQAQVFNVYGTTEIGGGQAIGMPGSPRLYLNEVQLLAEILDPDTSQPSARGELAFTTLAREAMPLLRYRTGDIGRWESSGNNLPLRSFVVEGRIGDMFVVSGVNLYAPVIAQAMAGIKALTGRIEILVDKIGLVDRLELLVEHFQGREVAPDEVCAALLRVYPDLAPSLRIGSLLLEVRVVDRLGPSPKAFRIRDRRHR